MKSSSVSEKASIDEGTHKQKKKTIEDFEIHGVIGEGSFAKVYSASDKSDNKTYAIKILDKYHIMKHKKVENVFRERDLLRELTHQNIIKQFFTF